MSFLRFVFLMFFFLKHDEVFSQDFIPKSFSADYEEFFKSLINGAEKKSYGKIDYLYPKNIRFEVSSPDVALFVANSHSAWYYIPPFIDGEEGQVTISKTDSLAIAKILDLLHKGLSNNRAYQVQFFQNHVDISFEKSIKDQLKIEKVVLESIEDPKKIKDFFSFNKLVLHKSDGQIVNIIFKNVKTNVVFDKDYFVFKIPKNTKVIR